MIYLILSFKFDFEFVTCVRSSSCLMTMFKLLFDFEITTYDCADTMKENIVIFS